MRNKVQKGKCIKQTLLHFEGVVKTFDDLQNAAAKSLSDGGNYISIQANVDCMEMNGIKYTSDFLCMDSDGGYTVYECVYRKYIDKPKTVKLLNSSQRFWKERGCAWGLIIEKEE